MFKQKKEKTSNQNIYEYAFTPVPRSQRKKTFDIFIVLTGYVMALSCLVTGVQLGYSMTFWSAVSASFLGNLILVFIGVTMGMVACRHGWSTTFLSRKAFGNKASALFSVCIILLSINWIGVNGDTFAHLLIPPVPGIILGEEFFGAKDKKDKKDINWTALVAWALGSIVGMLSLNQPHLIAPLMAMGMSFLSYIVLGRVFK